MVVPWTVKQSSYIFSEAIAGFRFKSPPYHYMQGWLGSRVTGVRLAVYTGWILQATFDLRQIIHTSPAEISYTNNRKLSKHGKTTPVSLYFVDFEHSFVYISADFSAVNTWGIPTLFHVLISTSSCM